MSDWLSDASVDEPPPMVGVQGLLATAGHIARGVPEREMVVLCAYALAGELAAVRAAIDGLRAALPPERRI